MQVILRALKKYGMILADNGSAWYLSGAPDSRWNNDDLHLLGNVPGSAFEAVDVSSLMVDANSGQARQYSACDVNHDGAVNVVDVQLSVNQILGRTGCINGDLNGDGSCSVVDLQRIVLAILGQGCRVGP